MPKNDTDYIIWASNGDMFYIPKDEMNKYKLDRGSMLYQDIANDPVTNAMSAASVEIGDDGHWQPFGATCAMIDGVIPDEFPQQATNWHTSTLISKWINPPAPTTTK
ncbi:MAG: hypothetical protein AAFV98_02435 [Chloroflexota bacterium]